MEVMKVYSIKKRMLIVKVVVINGGNMDRGTNGFTSDVSLPKDEGKVNISYDEQITVGQLTKL